MSTTRWKRHARTILMAVTVDQSLKLMWGFPEFLADSGWRVHVVTSGDSEHPPTFYAGPGTQATFHVLPMERNPSPGKDFVALLRWVWLLLRVRPAVVYIGTPKASLLGLTASALTRVPCRIYLLRGLRLEGETGSRRTVLLWMERLTALMAHKVVCVSRSLESVAGSYRIGNSRKHVTLGEGSSNGITMPGEPDLPGSADRLALRRTIGLQDGIRVVGFVGRVTPDKGLDDLVGAASLLSRRQDFQLLIVGAEDETGYFGALKAKADLLAQNCVFTGYLANAQDLYDAMDIFTLPSRREGMPNVSLEAAAHGLPVITTDATGCVDSVVNGETGVVYPVGDTHALAEILADLLDNNQKASEMGVAGSQWVAAQFARPIVWQRYESFFSDQLAGRIASQG